MDLIRLIKLKKLNGELNNLTEYEEIFFSFFNRKDLDIIKYGENVVFYNENQRIFKYNFVSNSLTCSNRGVFSIYREKYRFNDAEIRSLIKNILKKRLNLVNIKVVDSHYISKGKNS